MIPELFAEASSRVCALQKRVCFARCWLRTAKCAFLISEGVPELDMQDLRRGMFTIGIFKCNAGTPCFVYGKRRSSLLDARSFCFSPKRHSPRQVDFRGLSVTLLRLSLASLFGRFWNTFILQVRRLRRATVFVLYFGTKVSSHFLARPVTGFAKHPLLKVLKIHWTLLLLMGHEKLTRLISPETLASTPFVKIACGV